MLQYKTKGTCNVFLTQVFSTILGVMRPQLLSTDHAKSADIINALYPSQRVWIPWVTHTLT